MRRRGWIAEPIEVVVCYDVSTETRAGQKRLRTVAAICVAHGQRVQKSVFECRLTLGQLEGMEDQLRRAMSEAEDRLRIYRLAGPRERYVKIYGVEPPHDFREPLII